MPEPQQVGAIQLPLAQANPHGGGGVGRSSAKLAHPYRQQRQAGGGAEFPGGKALAGSQRHLPAAGQLQHRWSRQGQGAVGGGHPAVARRRRRGQQVIDTEIKQPGTDPHHIHQGIHGPHLMEMHLFRGAAMHRGLRLRQALKHRQHPLAQGLRPGGRL